jgi:NAD(P)H-hydrate epimerase
MSPTYLTRDQVRSVDRRANEEFGIPSLLLMENAGRGVAEWLIPRLNSASRVLILCGSGNNGGDGGVIARQLDLHGVASTTLWFGEPKQFSSDARTQFEILERAGFESFVERDPGAGDRLASGLSSADWVVDALLGTGLTRPVEGRLRDVIAAIGECGKPVLAVDLPSGLDADTGRPLGIAVRASATVTFVAPKLGFSVPGASDYTGPVFVAHIGIPRRVLDRLIPAPP